MSPTLRVLVTLTGFAALVALDIISNLWPSRWLVLAAVGLAAAILAGLVWSTASAWWDEATEHRRGMAARARVFAHITARRHAPPHDEPSEPATDVTDEAIDAYEGWFTAPTK